MHLQPISNTTPNFQANHLRSVKVLSGALQAKQDVIDIYSINKSDKDVIQKLLNKIDMKDRRDGFAVKEKNTVNNAIRLVLNRALGLSNDKDGGVYLAIKNNKKVAGVLDYTMSEAPLLKNLVAWRGSNQEAVRANLFSEFLKNVNDANQKVEWHDRVDVFAYAEPESKGNKWLKESGFRAPAQEKIVRERLELDANLIPSSIHEKDTISPDIRIVPDIKKENVELKDLQI